MKLNIIKNNNNFQMPEQARAERVSQEVIGTDAHMTAPTQNALKQITTRTSSAASNIVSPNTTQALKAQTLAQAPIPYSYIKDIKLPFANNAKLYRLANGQKVVILEKKGPTVLETYYNVGSMNEPDHIRGISHFNEHMAFNGSKDPNGNGFGAGDFFKVVNKLGAYTNASTSFSQTNYYIASQLLGEGDVFDTSVYLQSQQLQYPEHTREMVEKEKAPVTSEISMVNDQEENIAINQCIKNLYQIKTTSPDLIAGTISNINKLTREDTLDYYNTWYTPDNSVTVVTGEIPAQEAIDTIAKYFNKNSYVPKQNRKYQEFNGIQKPIRTDIKVLKAQSSTIALGFSGPQNNSTKENIIAEVLMFALLGYKNARIKEELKNIQSTASITCERIGNRPTDPRTILILSQSTPQKTEQVIKTIYEEINKIIYKPLSQNELNTIKKYLKMNFSKISEQSQTLNNVLGNAILDDSIDYVENYINILENITAQDVSNLAKKYLDLNKASLTVVHPEKITNEELMRNYEKLNNTQKLYPQTSKQTIAFKGKLDNKKYDINKVKQYKLANNLEVVLNPNQSDIANAKIKLLTTEPVKTKPGLTAILTYMLNEGSLSKDSSTFFESINKNGIDIQFSASHNGITADIEALGTDIPFTIDLAKEVLTQPRLNQDTLNSAKKAIEDVVQNIEKIAEEPALKEIFPELTEFATKEEILKSINTITLNDIYEYYNFIKQNAMAKAIVTAPIDKNPEIENAVLTKLTVGLREFKPFKAETHQIFQPIKENKIFTQSEQRNQADIVQIFNFKTNYNPKDTLTFSLLNNILGGSSSSRLFNDLRETQKLAYRVESNLDYRGDCGVIALKIKTTTDNPSENVQQFENVEKSLKGFAKHIDILKNELVTQEELNAAKLKFKTGLLNSFETSFSQTNLLSNAKSNFSGINSINEKLELIDQITPEDIRNAAKYVFAGKSIVSILASQKTLDNMNTNITND